MKTPQKLIVIEVRKWFDSVNGNTYSSAKVTRVDTGESVVCPFEYGYGSYYEQMVLMKLCSVKWFRRCINSSIDLHERGIVIECHVKKREMFN
jgi:hypothetical protein